MTCSTFLAYTLIDVQNVNNFFSILLCCHRGLEGPLRNCETYDSKDCDGLNKPNQSWYQIASKIRQSHREFHISNIYKCFKGLSIGIVNVVLLNITGSSYRVFYLILLLRHFRLCGSSDNQTSPSICLSTAVPPQFSSWTQSLPLVFSFYLHVENLLWESVFIRSSNISYCSLIC
jgi:hypothetical protein